MITDLEDAQRHQRQVNKVDLEGDYDANAGDVITIRGKSYEVAVQEFNGKEYLTLVPA